MKKIFIILGLVLSYAVACVNIKKDEKSLYEVIDISAVTIALADSMLPITGSMTFFPDLIDNYNISRLKINYRGVLFIHDKSHLNLLGDQKYYLNLPGTYQFGITFRFTDSNFNLNDEYEPYLTHNYYSISNNFCPEIKQRFTCRYEKTDTQLSIYDVHGEYTTESGIVFHLKSVDPMKKHSVFTLKNVQ